MTGPPTCMYTLWMATMKTMLFTVVKVFLKMVPDMSDLCNRQYPHTHIRERSTVT